MAGPRQAIETLRERIEDSDDISDADAEVLLEFSDQLFLRSSETGEHRHEKLLRHGTIIAENVGGVAAALDDREAAEEIVSWIHETYGNEETNRDYRVAIRMIGRHASDGDDSPPESIDWIPSGTSSNYDPKPDPAEMLHWDEHVEPMIDAARNSRDAALIALAWDAGPRGGELKSLRYGDISDHDYGLQVSVDGKRGQRSVTLIPSVPYVQRWLDDHPSKEGTDPLWSKLSKPERISSRMLYKALEECAERADVGLPVTPTNFRKSSASYAASEGLSQAHLEDRYGWVRGSDAAARYVAVFGEASDRALAEMHGKDVSEDDQSDPLGPIECPRCGRDTPRDRDFCMWCNQAIERGAVEDLEDDRQQMRRDFLKFAAENPEILEDAERREEVVSELARDPEMLGDALEFIEALGQDDH